MTELSKILDGRNRLNSSMPRPSRMRGFTLIELMVTITIVAILLAIAIPSFSELALSSKLSANANSLVAGAHLARSEAIKRNAVVTLCASANATSCNGSGWEDGWIILSGTTVIKAQEAASSGMRLNGSVLSINFQPTGASATQATITVCRKTPTVGGKERVVTISSTGRTSVAKTTAGVCP
jgi:type IV fimbrial biogenesis protein FimT